MFGGIIQFAELLVNYRLHPFLVFFVLVWGLFIFRVVMARRNKTITLPASGEVPGLTASALIMSFRDPPEMLQKSLDSIRNQTAKFDEVFVVLDAKEGVENIEIAKRSGFTLFFDTGGNKRTAYAGAFKASKGEIVAMLAGDTIYPPNMLEEALKCFAHPKIGGVGLRQRIYDRNRNLIRRFADIMYSLRYKITYPCLSSKGALLCTTGETAFFRRAPVEKHLDEFLHEVSWGKRCVIGDDRFLTSMVLKEGYDVVLQPSTEPALTDCPNSLQSFINQQLRWYRSNQKYSMKTLFQNWIPGKSPVLKVHLAGFLLLPYLWLAVVGWWIVNSLTRTYPVEVLGWPFLATLPLWVAGFFLASAIKASPHLIGNRQDWRVLPLYALFAAFVILPAFVYALLTIRDQGSWETKRPGNSYGFVRTKTLLLILLPLIATGVLAWLLWEWFMPQPVVVPY